MLRGGLARTFACVSATAGLLVACRGRRFITAVMLVNPQWPLWVRGQRRPRLLLCSQAEEGEEGGLGAGGWAEVLSRVDRALGTPTRPARLHFGRRLLTGSTWTERCLLHDIPYETLAHAACM